MNHDPYNMEDINDIVLNRNNSDKSANIKKILTAVAILIILFLIVLIIMKFINRGNIDTNSNLTMPSEAELAKNEQKPKLEPIVIAQKTEPKKEEPKIEIKQPEKPKVEPENKFEIKKEEPRGQVVEIKKEEPKLEPIVVKEEPKKVETPKIEPKKEEPKKPETTKVEPKKEEPKAQPKPEQKKEQPKTEPKKSEPAKKVEPKKEEPKKQESTKTATKGGAPQNVSSLTSGNYIQVYALSQYTPNSPSVKKISEKGYTPLAFKSGNLTRVLVGPFKNETELNKALSDMRSISKDSFVQRVK